MKLTNAYAQFGLVNASKGLQRQASHLFFCRCNEGWMVICMDRVLGFSTNVQEHFEHMCLAAVGGAAAALVA